MFKELLTYTENQRIKKLLLMILMSMFLIGTIFLINYSLLNNSRWLEGTWTCHSDTYTFKAENKKNNQWSIKENGKKLLTDAELSTASNKDNLIVTNSDSTIQYEASKINWNSLSLTKIAKEKRSKPLILTRK